MKHTCFAFKVNIFFKFLVVWGFVENWGLSGAIFAAAPFDNQIDTSAPPHNDAAYNISTHTYAK